MYFTSVNMMGFQHIYHFMDLSVKGGLKMTCIQVETCCLCNKTLKYLCLRYHCSTSLVLSKRNVIYSIKLLLLNIPTWIQYNAFLKSTVYQTRAAQFKSCSFNWSRKTFVL